MKIGMILRKNFPPDIRVEKEVKALISAGHEVFLICYKNKNQQETENLKGLTIYRIEVPWEVLPWLKHKWNSFKFYMLFRNDYWANKISRFINDYNLDALHVHDLPLLGTAIYVGRKFDIPIISDLHENYPASLGILDKEKMGLWKRFCTSPERWQAYERKAISRISKIIVVVQEAKERLLKEYNTPEEKIITLMNVVDMEYFSRIKFIPEILKRYKENFLILYLGGGGVHRGLVTTLHSIRYLSDEIPNIKLLLIGPMGSERDRLLRIKEKEGIQEKVDLMVWQDFKKVPSYIKASDICLVPHQKNYHTDTTIPHKLFQYMFNKKPVVVSDCKPLKRIVEETSSGLIFKSGKPEDLARKIIKLYEDKRLRLLFGQNGYDSVINHYNWAKESTKLVSLYKSLT